MTDNGNSRRRQSDRGWLLWARAALLGAFMFILSLQHWFQIIAQTLLIKDTSSTRLRRWIREEPAARYDELPATLTVLAAEDIADSIDALYHKDEAMAGDAPLSLVHASAGECLRESE